MLNTWQASSWKWRHTPLMCTAHSQFMAAPAIGKRVPPQISPLPLQFDKLLAPLSGQPHSRWLVIEKTLQMGFSHHSAEPLHGILLEGGRLLTWLMKLYLNLVDLGLQRHFSLLRASRMKGVCYLYQTPRLKWFANWPLCNRVKVSC